MADSSEVSTAKEAFEETESPSKESSDAKEEEPAKQKSRKKTKQIQLFVALKFSQGFL